MTDKIKMSYYKRLVSRYRADVGVGKFPEADQFMDALAEISPECRESVSKMILRLTETLKQVGVLNAIQLVLAVFYKTDLGKATE